MVTNKSKENLKPYKKGELSKELAKEMQLKSAEKRKENNQAKLIFKEAIEKRMGIDDFNEIIDNLITRAKLEDKSLEVLRDTLGQKPKEQIEQKQEIKISMENDLGTWGK